MRSPGDRRPRRGGDDERTARVAPDPCGPAGTVTAMSRSAIADAADFARAAERLARDLPDASLEHVAGAGHLLALDQPAAVARVVERHLAAAAVTRRASPPR